jgi:single-stranded-DNA-specific exonuclease
MVKYLKARNANVSYYIPDREEEGYGLNIEALKKLKKAKTDLIITVDNGIVAVEEAKLAKELGIDLIITDHHALRDSIPDALAVIDPLREEYNGFAKIAGVCVAFKLIVALEKGNFTKAFNDYGALVCIGTIADVMPVISENRYIVEKGLELLQKEQTPGIEALKQSVRVSGNKITLKDISFIIAPMLNAASRLNSINTAVDLLMSEDKQESKRLAEELKQKNQERKQLEKEALNSALDFLAKNTEEQDRKIIIIDGNDWHPGVLGIVAAKIADKFSKPCIVIGKYEKIAKGSGRSVGEFPLIDALNNVEECLIKYGGHKSAVGFSIYVDRIEEFKRKLEDYVEKNFLTMPSSKLIIDKEVDLKELSVKNISELELLQPFGSGNEEPLFKIKDVKIKQIIPLCGGKYVKLRVVQQEETSTLSCFKRKMQQEKTSDLLCFSTGINEFLYKPGENIDAIVSCKVECQGSAPQTKIVVKDILSKKKETEKEGICNEQTTK